MKHKGLLILLACILFSGKVFSEPNKVTVESPDHHLRMEFYLKKDKDQNALLHYDVSYNGMPVVLDSQMGLNVEGKSYWKENYEITGVEQSTKDTTWKPIYGQRDVIKDDYNELIVHLAKIQYPSRKMDLVIRAYNAGVAFKYAFPKSKDGKSLFYITGDETQFTMPADTKGWVAYRPQGTYEKLPLSGWEGNVCRPLTLELKNGLYVTLTEAEMVTFARAQFTLDESKANTIVCSLSGDVTKYLPFATPWRVIMVAETPGDLIRE